MAMRLKVIVRVRPMSQREKNSDSQNVVSLDGTNSIAVTNIKVPEQNAGDSRERVRRFAFDYCFSEDTTQEQIFETVENLIGTSLRKRNHSCVLAYGQTSSGKTHTMMGSPNDSGLTPRLCRRIFKYFEEATLDGERDKMNVSVSYLEIYNEKVADLLSQKSSHDRPLKVREHPKRGPYVEGLSQHTVTTDTELLERLHEGTNKRRVGSTSTNPKSSRSHSVFSICCDGVKLHLVDLAGNERAGSRGYGPNRFREGANINKSLVALGNVISTLADQSKSSSSTSRNKFVPYRDSVLTWLLKDTLQGNSNTVMIATISPSSTYYSETVNTLRFGQRAKLIVYKPVIVEDPKERTIRELRAEVARLRDLLQIHMNTAQMDVPSPASQSNSETDLSTLSTQEESPPQNICETLVPIMDVKTQVVEEKLKRTFSVDRRYSNETSFSSQESLQSPKHVNGKTSRKSSLTSSSRRDSGPTTLPPTIPPKQNALSKSRYSINRSAPSLKTITQKKPLEPKPKPRAQIVAAVTSRLYSKVNKKDIGTSTETENLAVTKTLGSLGARNRLRDLTQRALRAQRSRNEETQTERPILRVKEVATDCSDLKLDSCQVKDACTSERQELKDAEVECTLLNQFIEGTLPNILMFTRSCGIQTSDDKAGVSFKKYLTGSPGNPIITESVNININHNYINGHRHDSLSDDSLDRTNVAFPTPDLISNHNSLEQNALAEPTVRQAQVNVLHDVFETVNYIPCASTASVLTVPCYYHKSYKTVDVLKGFAPEIHTKYPFTEKCQPLPDFCPKKIKPKVGFHHTDMGSVTSHKPTTFVCPECRSSSSDDEVNIPDSLEYHMANHKKVQFARKGKHKGDRMYKAMREFLEEAKTLMSNINRCQHPHLEDYDIQVTLNDVSEKRPSTSTQTDEPSSMDSCFSLAEYMVPVNKYETLLEDSCRRLEEQLKKPQRSRHISITSDDYDDELFERPKYNPWDLSHVEVEDSSLESNPVTFSDYGSLPRKTHKRHRTPTCSPSAFLKQLTQMRRQIIENSREDLVHGCGSSK